MADHATRAAPASDPATDATPVPVASDSPRAWQVVLEHVESRLLSGELAPGDRLPGERALVGRTRRRPLERPRGPSRARGARPHPHPDRLRPERGRDHHRDAGRRHERAHAPAGRGAAASRSPTSCAPGSSSRRRSPATSPTRHPGPTSARRRPARRDGRPRPHATEFLALDAAFHLALAEASGNQVITATMAGLRSGIEGYARAGVARIADWDATCRAPATRAPRHRRGHHGGGCRGGAHPHPRPHLGLLRRDRLDPSSTPHPPRRRDRPSAIAKVDRVTSRLPNERAPHHGPAPVPQPQRARRAHAVQDADAQRDRPAAREGAHDRRPARDREAPHAEGAVRLHRGRRRGRALARPCPPGVPGHRVPPVDPAQRARRSTPPARCSAARARCRSASRPRASPASCRPRARWPAPAPPAPRASRSPSRRSAPRRSRT